jgi:hypothetical protein
MKTIDTSKFLEMTQKIITILDANIEVIPAIKEEFSLIPCFFPEEIAIAANENSVVMSQLEEYITEKFQYKFPIEVQINAGQGMMIRLAVGKDGGFKEHTLPILMAKIKPRIIEDKAKGILKVPFRLSKDELELLDSKINHKNFSLEIFKMFNLRQDDIDSVEFSSIGAQIKRHTPIDSAKQKLYVIYGGKLGAYYTKLFGEEYLNLTLLELEAKEFITKTLKAYNMDINLFKKVVDLEEKQDMANKVLTTLQYGLETLLCSENIQGAIFHMPTSRMKKEIEKYEKENPFFKEAYFKVDKESVVDYASFQLYIINLAEAIIREQITPNYFCNSDRYGYKNKINTLIKYILADAKHPEIKEARQLVVDLLNEIHEENPAISVIHSQELISRYHGLNKNLEVVDVSHVLKTLEQIKNEIEALNTIINPTYKLVSLERKVLAYIDNVGVDLNTKDSHSFGNLRAIVSSIKNPKSRFKLRDLKAIANVSGTFIKDHIVKNILEYHTTLYKSLQENSAEYQELKEKLGEYPWRELSENLRKKGKLTMSKTIKLDKHVDNSKEKRSDSEENAYQDGVAQVLSNAVNRLSSYIEKESEAIINTKKRYELHVAEAKSHKKGSSEFVKNAQKAEEYKKLYAQKSAKSLFVYREIADDDIVVATNPKAIKSLNLEDFRQALLRSANALFDTEIEIMKNLEVLNGKKTKNGISIGFLKELLNVWDTKDKQLQIKYRELKNSQGEKNQEIESDIETLIETMSDYLVEKQMFHRPISKDSIFITYMPKNNIQIIESQVRESMAKKNNAEDVIKKFLLDYTFIAVPYEQSKLQEGVLELLRRKNIHEQDKDKFISLINKHFDLVKEKEQTQEQLAIEFEMPQRLISAEEESSIMNPIDTTKDMRENVIAELKEEQNKDSIEEEKSDTDNTTTPDDIVLDKFVKSILDIKHNSDSKLVIKSKYEKSEDKHIVTLAMSFEYKTQKEVYRRKLAISLDNDFKESIHSHMNKIFTEFAKAFISKSETKEIKKESTEILKLYLQQIKSIKL